MSKKQLIVTIITVVLMAGVAFKARALLLERKAAIAAEPTPKNSIENVVFVAPQEGKITAKEPFLATLKADKSIALATKIPGRVQRVFVHEAQDVKKGELLVSIDAQELKMSIAALLATNKALQKDYAVAKSIYESNKKLYEAGGLSKEKLDLSYVAMLAKKAQLQSNSQQIAQQKHQLSYLEIRAPFDGVVDSVVMHEGDFAAVGRAVVTMSNYRQKLLFSYPLAQKNSVAAGQSVLLDGKKVGVVKRLYSQTKEALGVAEVELKEALDLPYGAEVSIEVITKEASGCIVPNRALLYSKEGVFVVLKEGEVFTPFGLSLEIQNDKGAIVKPCPQSAVAVGSQERLSVLAAHSVK